MNNQTKLGLLAALIAVALVVGIWRTRAALKEANAMSAGAPLPGYPTTGWSRDWVDHLTVSEVAPTPEDAKGDWWTIERADPKVFHLTKLAHFRWRDAIGRLDHLPPDNLFYPMANKTLELGGTLVAPGVIEDEGSGLAPNEGILNLDLYLMTTGPIELTSVKERHLKLCALINVDPAGAGARQGLANGDLITAVDDFSYLENPGPKPCKGLPARLAKPEGEPLHLELLRGGKKTVVEIKAAGNKGLGTGICEAIVLDSDLAH